MAALQYTNYMIMDIYFVLYVSFTTRKYLDEFALPISLVKLQASCFIVMLHFLSIALSSGDLEEQFFCYFINVTNRYKHCDF